MSWAEAANVVRAAYLDFRDVNGVRHTEIKWKYKWVWARVGKVNAFQEDKIVLFSSEFAIFSLFNLDYAASVPRAFDKFVLEQNKAIVVHILMEMFINCKLRST